MIKSSSNFILLLLSIAFVLLFTSTISTTYGLKGSATDSSRFHEYAIQWVEQGEYKIAFDLNFFIQFVGSVYLITFNSKFIFSLLVLFVNLYSIILIRKVLRFQNIGFPVWILFFLFINPINLPRLTTVMREPFIMFLMILFVYILVVKRSILKSFFALAAAALFHKAFVLIFLVFGPMVIFYEERFKRLISGMLKPSRILVLICILFLGYFASKYMNSMRGLRPLALLLDGGAEGVVGGLTSKHSVDAGAKYATLPKNASLVGFILNALRNYFFYMFGPMPNQFTGILYPLLAVLSYIRFFLFFYCVRYFKRANYEHKLIFLLYIGATLIWSLGTINFGTASRHHITTDILLIFVYLNISQVKHKYSSSFRFRKGLSIL